MSENLKRPTDNATTWLAQYPELLPKNFTGISVVYDENNPPVTRGILPAKNMPFNFTQRIKIDPLIMAPEVQEGGSTPLADREYIVEKFVCVPYRLGSLITDQQIRHGLQGAVQDVTQDLVNAVNLSITYDNIMKLQGIGVQNQKAIERLNLAVAGKPHGTGSATEWSDEDSDIIGDIVAMKTDIKVKSGKTMTSLFVSTIDHEHIMNNNGIKEQLKYVTPDFLTNGEIPMIKGVKIFEVDTYYKDRKKREAKIAILSGKAIATTDDVGYTAYADPLKGSAPEMDRWEDKDRRSVVVQARASTVSVVKDFGRVGIISGISS